MKKTKTVEEYILGAPTVVRPKLVEMRKAIKAVAPEALEKLSYGMPYYGHNGALAYFAYAKKHVGLYVPPPVIKMYAKDLKQYQTATATVRFPLDKKLPISLIKKLVKARIKLNQKKK